MSRRIHFSLIALAVFCVSGHAQTTLTGLAYEQNFDSLTSDGLPLGWATLTGATPTSRGLEIEFEKAPPRIWSDTDGRFGNFAAATGLFSNSDRGDQNGSSDRALGMRQSASFGNPGASFQFNFVSTGLAITGLSIDLMMLDVGARSTTWSLQWSGDGASWNTLGTWADPGAFGTTTKSFTASSVGGMSNLSNGYFRVAALDASFGSGGWDTIAIDNFSLTYRDYASVPEPATYALLLGVGVLGLAGFRRFRAKRSVPTVA